MTRRERSAIRSEMRAVLGGLDPRWLKGASTELGNNISALIENHDEFNFQHILAWTSFFAGEPDLSGFISRHIDQQKIYLPRVSSDGGMDFLCIGRDWGNQIEAGIYGIPEPSTAAGVPFDVSNAPETLILVPGLAFDETGSRLGRGKGYYDRFLARPGMEQALRLGVCWEIQLVERITAEAHDIPVDMICHERSYLECVQI